MEKLYQTYKILTKTFFKVRIGIVENLLAAMLNPKQPKKRVRQPLCDPSDIRKMDKREKQSLDDLLHLRPRPWGISRGITDQHPIHDSITILRQLFFRSTSLEQFRNYFHGDTKSILLKQSVHPLSGKQLKGPHFFHPLKLH